MKSSFNKNSQHVKMSRLKDRILKGAGIFCLSFSILFLCLLFGNLLINGLDRLSWAFLSNFPSRFPEKAGILSALVGTCAVMLVTAFFVIPIGISAAIYLEEYAQKNKLTRFIELNISNLAGVPSILFGLMALGLFVYQLSLGQSILTAGLTLSLLVLPIIIVASREAIKAVPQSLREASYALGASKWQTIRDHVLPYSAGGIFTGIIIALSRAIGETAPLITIGALTFIAFLPTSPIKENFPFFSAQWLMDPFTVIPIQMFNWISRPQSEFHLNAAAAGLILLVVTLCMNGFAIYFRNKYRKKIKW